MSRDPNTSLSTWPKKYSATALLQIKRALEECRRREEIVSRSAVEAELALTESAAEMGDPTAIALLCGSRMSEKDISRADQEDGSRLLTQLMDRRFPLAFKVSGDLAYRMGQQEAARRFYELALENDENRDVRLAVECHRNLGHIEFRNTRLLASRHHFTQACRLAADSHGDIHPRQVADCHFFLAQLREPDRLAVRKHLEIAASSGLHEAFVPCGNLLLNWFGEPRLAIQWFQLALATDKSGEAIVGLLDAAISLRNRSLVAGAVEKVHTSFTQQDAEILLKSRAQLIEDLGITRDSHRQSPISLSGKQLSTAGDRWQV